jgi:hypothetical protein
LGVPLDTALRFRGVLDGPAGKETTAKPDVDDVYDRIGRESSAYTKRRFQTVIAPKYTFFSPTDPLRGTYRSAMEAVWAGRRAITVMPMPEVCV